MKELDAGGRILRAVVRPYPAKTAGIPLEFDYEMNTGAFRFKWVIPSSTSSAPTSIASSSISPPLDVTHELKSNETEIFFPSMLAHGRKVVAQGLDAGDEYEYDETRQTLTIRTADNTPGRARDILVNLDPPLEKEFDVNSFWTDFKLWIFVVVAVIYSVLIR